MHRSATWLAIALAAGLLAACGGAVTPEPDDPNVTPVKYKQDILDVLSRDLGFPTKVRGAFVSEPALTQVGKERRFTACLRYNARDSETHYAGSKDFVAYFYGGRLNQLVEATPQQCGNAAYKPFPELENFCFAAKCN